MIKSWECPFFVVSVTKNLHDRFVIVTVIIVSWSPCSGYGSSEADQSFLFASEVCSCSSVFCMVFSVYLWTCYSSKRGGMRSVVTEKRFLFFFHPWENFSTNAFTTIFFFLSFHLILISIWKSKFSSIDQHIFKDFLIRWKIFS